MRPVTNEKALKRNRTLAHVVFILSVAVLGAGLFISWRGGDPNEMLIPALILPVGMALSIMAVRMTNLWIREPAPHEVLADSLRSFSNKTILYNYCFPVRHVIICPSGVFTVTTRFQEGKFAVKGDKWRDRPRGIFGYIGAAMRQELLGNPTAQARREAARMQKVLDQAVPDSGVRVEPLIVFLSDKAEFEAEEPVVPVLYADPRRSPSLREHLRRLNRNRERPALTKAQIEALEAKAGISRR